MTQVKVATPSINRVHPDVDNCGLQTYIVRFCKPTTKHVLCSFTATAKTPEIAARFAGDWAAQATNQPYDLYVDVTSDNTDALDLSTWN